MAVIIKQDFYCYNTRLLNCRYTPAQLRGTRVVPIVASSYSSRPTLGPTHPPLQWLPRPSTGYKVAGEFRWPPTPSTSAGVRNEYSYTVMPTLCVLWYALGWPLPSLHKTMASKFSKNIRRI